jgi:hypothetical protein
MLKYIFVFFFDHPDLYISTHPHINNLPYPGFGINVIGRSKYLNKQKNDVTPI